MPTKLEISKALNEFLGTSIAWDMLKREDLETVLDIFDNPKELIRRLMKEEAADRLKARSKDLVDLVEEGLGGIPRPFGVLDKILEKKEKS